MSKDTKPAEPTKTEPKKPDFKQQIAQLEQAKIEEQAILKRGLQTFLASIDNVISIDNKTIEILRTELKKND